MDDKKKPFQDFTKKEEEEIWNNIFSATRTYDRKRKKRNLLLFSSALAVTVFFLGIAGFLFLKTETYNAGNNNLQIVLSDKSEITLFRGSSLTVDNFLWKNARNVYLNGNGLFKVSKSKEQPFIVHGRNYETKVLGTIFKIYQSDKTFSVDLYEGKVIVYRSEKPNESFELKPKETFSNLGITQVARISPTSKSIESNIKSSLSFNDCSLIKVAQIIEETYNIKLLIPDKDKDVKITISSTNSTAKSLIEIIAFQFDFNIKQINDKTFQLE
ncbi:FecR family protein [Chryseobacterium sp. Marseille-Q8038]